MGGHLIDRTRAQTAADAAALGSVVGGRDAAEALADRHGATLVSFRRGPGPGRVTVVVRVRNGDGHGGCNRRPVSARDDSLSCEVPTLVEMSKTERDLDLESGRAR